MSRSLCAKSVIVAAALLALGCSKTTAQERRESERATAEAEERASETTLTSATIETDREAREVRDDALRERADLIAAVRREQLEYRAKIRAELDALDAELEPEDVRTAEAAVRGTRLARRDALKDDLLALDASTGHDWATLKARIDRHLDGEDIPVEARSAGTDEKKTEGR